MATRHIQKKFFNDAGKSAFLRRLRTLKQRGLIIQAASRDNGERVWILSAKGNGLLGFKNKTLHVNKNKINHDLLVNDIVESLERVGLCHYYRRPEIFTQEHLHSKQALRFDAIVSDGVFAMDTVVGPRIFALELEITRKGKDRYSNTYVNYTRRLRERTIDFILYVVPGVEFGEFLTELFTSNYGFQGTDCNHLKGRFLFVKVDDVLEDPLNATIHTPFGKTKLSSFAKPFYRMTKDKNQITNSKEVGAFNEQSFAIVASTKTSDEILSANVLDAKPNDDQKTPINSNKENQVDDLPTEPPTQWAV